jgi:hypothetical protein
MDFVLGGFGMAVCCESGMTVLPEGSLPCAFALIVEYRLRL